MKKVKRYMGDEDEFGRLFIPKTHFKEACRMAHPSRYVNQYCYRSSVSRFLETEKPVWLKDMAAAFGRVSPHKLKPGQIVAWADEYDVLRAALSALPEAYRRYELVFEYVMPKFQGISAEDPGCRADVILLAEKAVAVLEFKQRDEATVYAQRQLRGYQRRLKTRHVQSVGMTKPAVLVLTKAPDGLNTTAYRMRICAADRLADVLRERVDGRRMSAARVREWLRSEWLPESKSAD